MSPSSEGKKQTSFLQVTAPFIVSKETEMFWGRFLQETVQARAETRLLTIFNSIFYSHLDMAYDLSHPWGMALDNWSFEH